MNAKLDASAITSYYSKSETDTLLNLMANSANVYAKTEADALLNLKLNASQIANYYTSTQVDSTVVSYYTRLETNNILNAKQNIIADGDLTIAMTNGLQVALNDKQTVLSHLLGTGIDLLTSNNIQKIW